MKSVEARCEKIEMANEEMDLTELSSKTNVTAADIA